MSNQSHFHTGHCAIDINRSLDSKLSLFVFISVRLVLTNRLPIVKINSNFRFFKVILKKIPIVVHIQKSNILFSILVLPKSIDTGKMDDERKKEHRQLHPNIRAELD